MSYFSFACKSRMSKTYFVTGTDTDAGKTLICQALLIKATENQLKAFALKPVAAGATPTEQGLTNNDALLLQQAANVKLPYVQINPIVLQQAIAPHIAAEQEGRKIASSQLIGFIRGALLHKADLKLIEGAGGWLVPINSREYLSCIAKELQLEVILVVGIKLGCLNHALLTARAIALDGVKIAGWIGSQIEKDMPALTANIATLQQHLAAPCLGVVPYHDNITAAEAAAYITLPQCL